MFMKWLHHKASISKYFLTNSISLIFARLLAHSQNLPPVYACLIDDLFVCSKCVREFTPHQQLTYAYEKITQNAPQQTKCVSFEYLMQFQNAIFCVDKKNNERIEHRLIFLHVSHSLSVNV